MWSSRSHFTVHSLDGGTWDKGTGIGVLGIGALGIGALGIGALGIGVLGIEVAISRPCNAVCTLVSAGVRH